MSYTLKTWSGLALLRAFWWRHVRREDGEICHDCGHPVGRPLGTWWCAPDELWQRVCGSSGGVLCVKCFVKRCDAARIYTRVEVALDYTDEELSLLRPLEKR